ncbi:hypothetical protein [Alkaliphilus peptidifermentans]|uniref:Uncharacterized protein n=1 Tax=Alkaliphilus peptidifermentans DSM 18978 TaxID=1120976 RepID=A0A1G5IJ25_9FIRM|nr:hypothetical protein [Alkaliphilus peptidifermentans]SCY75428.1 hypothetical protein SAMN03080606_02380 [Alkaliphilus peptidifermentans DSM 18978]
MRIITSEELDNLLAYCDSTKISTTDYGTFLRALVYTMNKELPIEIIDNATNTIIKAHLKFFSIKCMEGIKGGFDGLKLQYILTGEDDLKTLLFDKIGKNNVMKDRKSGTRTFYRYYINENESSGYRFTFNRRISKE